MGMTSISTVDGKGQHGGVLLRCGTRPLSPILWIISGTGLVLWAILLMIRGPATALPLTIAGYLKIGALLFVGVLGPILGFRELRDPTVSFEVTETGIMVYRNGGMWLRHDLFVPWERIREVRYITYGHPDFSITRSGFGPGQRTAIGLKLHMDDNWPPQGTLKDVPWAAIKDEIFLDSESTSPCRMQLFDQIQKIRNAVACGQLGSLRSVNSN
jgi:hypothetical protein